MNNDKMAKAVVKQLDAHCDVIEDAAKMGNMRAVTESTDKVRELARRLEEWFILMGLNV